MSASNYVHINVENILRETEKAFKVRLGENDELWLPKEKSLDDFIS